MEIKLVMPLGNKCDPRSRAFSVGAAARGHAISKTPMSLADPKDNRPDLWVVQYNQLGLLKQLRKNDIPTAVLGSPFDGVGDHIAASISLNELRPTNHLYEMKMDDERRAHLCWEVPKWRTNKDGHIVLSISSVSEHLYYGLLHPSNHGEQLSRILMDNTGKKIICRMSRTWMTGPLPKGCKLSDNNIYSDLENAFAFVTHSHDDCLSALLYGTPAVVIGQGVTRPICSTEPERLFIGKPYKAAYKRVTQLLNNLAHFQYTLPEVKEGRMFDIIEHLMENQ